MACLTRQVNQKWNARGFLEHCFFPEELMRAETVAMIARVHHDCIAIQAASFNTFKNRAYASINERDQTQITLFDTPVFFGRNTKKKLGRQSLPIENSFLLLPFAH